MLSIKFECDKDIAAAKLISFSEMPIDLANLLWKKYKKEYKLLQFDFFEFRKKDFDRKILDEFEATQFFEQEFAKNKQNMERIKYIFEKNQEIIENKLLSMMKISHFNLPAQKIYINPGVNGWNFGKNGIFWGHPVGLEDPHYDLVYIYHEILHSYFKKLEQKSGEKHISHCLIQWLCDCSLCAFLKNDNIFFRGHKHLDETMKQIAPYFLLNQNKNECEFDLILKKFGIQSKYEHFVQYKNELENLNIDELYDWLLENQKIWKAGILNFENLQQED